MTYHKILLFVLIIICCVGQISFCAGPDQKHRPKEWHLIPGDYLSNDYLLTLEKTKSPLKARALETPQLIKVIVDLKGIHFQIIGGFHEGGPEFLMQENGSVITEIDAGCKISNVKIEVVDSQHVKMSYNSSNLESYSFVGHADQYVAAKCIVGKYADEKGQEDVFTEDGWAFLSNKKLKYTVGLDYPPFFEYDYFMSDSSEYAFKWREGILEIYNVIGGSLFEGGRVDKFPFLNLKKK